MSLGYVKMRRGIIEHASAGTINVAEFAILNLLILLADTATGSGTINATSLQARYCALSSNDTIQRALANLEARGYLFRLMSGSSKVASLYWINGYEATEGPNRMRRSDLSQVFVFKDITDLRWTGGAAEIPTEMSTDMPAEIPAEIPAEMPAEIPNSYKKKEERRKKQSPSSYIFKNVVKGKSHPARPQKSLSTTTSSPGPATDPSHPNLGLVPTEACLPPACRSYPRSNPTRKNPEKK